jgi:polysaccharide deacetylase family protein (PEP-CTERM system associated)
MVFLSHQEIRRYETRGEEASLKSIFSVDVEDWFHILGVPGAPQLSKWDSLPSRVEENFMRLLDIFDEKGVHVTCFFLGWVAEKQPGLVTEAVGRGHEVASHGYSHRLVYEMTDREFLDDIVRAKKTIEDIAGRPVTGYRSAGFSTTEGTPWFFDRLIEAGYRYDSSIFPAPRGHGGMKTTARAPYVVTGVSGQLVEFPISVINVLGRPVCFSGGGYLRFFPYFLIRRMAGRVLKEGRPVVFYIHPREVDPGHPRLSMSPLRWFKSYMNVSTVVTKITRLLSDFEVTTFERFLTEHPNLS